MYHYVEVNKDKNDYLRDRQNVPPHIFEQQILTLKKAGYKFITPKDLNELMSQEVTDKYVILSFDDGYRDFYTDAYPILKKHAVPAINYIIIDFLEGKNYMDKSMIKTLVKDDLIEIGSHTFTHPALIEDYKQAEKEIAESKKLLETEYKVNVVSFAYPYGIYDDKVVNFVKKAGYKNAVSVEEGNIANQSNLYTLRRLRPGHLIGNDLLIYIEKNFN